MITTPGEGGISKIKKRGRKYGAGAGLLKNGGGGGWHFSFLIFSRFVIFIFRNYLEITLCEIVLCI